VELGVHAAEVVGPAEIRALDLGLAHRQRVASGLNSTEARCSGFRFLQQLEVDLDAEDFLHAADVGPPRLFEGVEEGTRAGDTGGGIDDLVAVNPAAAALDLVLRAERKLTCGTGELA
jgi:hypothetical protein